MCDDFEAFLNERVSPEYRAIVLRFCEQMSSVAPEATRRMRGGTEKYYSVPVYRMKRDIIAISPTRTGVTFSFSGGASFTDQHGLLTGSGKRSRVVRVSKIDAYPQQAMADYIRQAVESDMSSRISTQP